MANVVDIYSVQIESLKELADDLEGSLHVIAHTELGDQIDHCDQTCLPTLRDLLAETVKEWGTFARMLNNLNTTSTAEYYVGEAYTRFIDLVKESIVRVHGGWDPDYIIPSTPETAADILYEFLSFPDPANTADYIELLKCSGDWDNLSSSSQESLLNEAQPCLDSMANGDYPKQ